VDINVALDVFPDISDRMLPRGFQNWLDFDTPLGLHEESKKYLAVKQHELIGWLLSMHFLAVLELVSAYSLDIIKSSHLFVNELGLNRTFENYLLSVPVKKYANDSSFLVRYSLKKPSKSMGKWYMNPIHFRISFDPIVTEALEDIIISGDSTDEIDLLHPKEPMLYNKNWIVDLGVMEKRSQMKIKHYNFGYQDSKKAHIFVRASGSFKLFLPFQLGSSIPKYYNRENINPSFYGGSKYGRLMFKKFIICGLREYYDINHCDIKNDMQFILGGESASVNYIDIHGANYTGKQHCILIPVPVNAPLTYIFIMEEDKTRFNKYIYSKLSPLKKRSIALKVLSVYLLIFQLRDLHYFGKMLHVLYLMLFGNKLACMSMFYS